MKRDYSSRYSAFHRKGKVTHGAAGRAGGDGQLNKVGGVLLTAVTLGAIVISVWFGWAVRASLNELDKENRARQELMARHEKLMVERQSLVKKERVESVAATLGLFPARQGQVQRP